MTDKPTIVLLIEDSPVQVRLMREILAEAPGFELECAETLGAGLNRLAQGGSDVVILDLTLPDAQGLDTLISVHCQFPEMPIVVMTAVADEALAADAVKFGAQDYLVKGEVQSNVLLRTLRYAIERKSQEERIRQLNEERDRRIIELASANKTLDLMTRQLMQARDQALEAASFKSDLVARVSHELRSPISTIIGMAELILQTPLNEQQREFTRVVQESCHALLDIVNSIVDLAKMEAGSIQLDSIDFAPVTLVEDALDLVRGAANDKELVLVSFLDPSLPTLLCGDPVRLKQILSNLLDNAVKFTARGTIYVEAVLESASEKDVTVRFSVSDTGIGLSEAARKRLFEPVIGTNGTTVRKYAGPGLGLSICKRLIDLMGGRLTVESEEGEGSTFSFSATFKRSAKAAMTGADFLAACAAHLKGGKILLVSDNPAARKAVQSYIACARLACDVAQDCERALEMLNKAKGKGSSYDACIVDLTASAAAGLEFAVAARLDEPASAMPVILISSVAAAEGANEDFAQHVRRPVRQSELIEAVARSLGRRDVEPRPAPSAVRRRASEAARGGQPDRLVLLAEDDDALKRLIALQLNKLGLAVDVVGSGLEAVEAAAAKRYALILMDCQMPHMDGYEATRVLRMAETTTGHHTPIVAMTAGAMPGDREKCLAAGMDDYLCKPVRLEQLQQLLERWLKIKPAAAGPDTAVPAAGPVATDKAAHPVTSANGALPLDLKRLAELYGQEFISDILPLFMKEAQQLLSKAAEANAQRDGQTLAQVAHQLKGVCASVAADEMNALALQLEKQGKVFDFEAAAATVAQLEGAFDRVKEFVTSLALGNQE